MLLIQFNQIKPLNENGEGVKAEGKLNKAKRVEHKIFAQGIKALHVLHKP